MSNTVRQIEKVLDVLYQIEQAMTAPTVMRPLPLAARVSSLIVDCEAWRDSLAGGDDD